MSVFQHPSVKVYIKDRFYKFESKSQPQPLAASYGLKCISKIVFTSLKANHNTPLSFTEIKRSVYQRSFLQVWKQITTSQVHLTYNQQCISKIVFTSLKANHNTVAKYTCCALSVYQRSFLQVWKQITTTARWGHNKPPVYIKDRFYKFESKSQPITSSTLQTK